MNSFVADDSVVLFAMSSCGSGPPQPHMTGQVPSKKYTRTSAMRCLLTATKVSVSDALQQTEGSRRSASIKAGCAVVASQTHMVEQDECLSSVSKQGPQ